MEKPNMNMKYGEENLEINETITRVDDKSPSTFSKLNELINKSSDVAKQISSIDRMAELE